MMWGTPPKSVGRLGKLLYIKTFDTLAAKHPPPQGASHHIAAFPLGPWRYTGFHLTCATPAVHPACSMEGALGRDSAVHSQPRASWHRPDGFSSPDIQADAVCRRQALPGP